MCQSVCVSCCWACWLCSPRWKGCTPQLSFLCFTVCSSRPCRTAITVNDPSHPRGEKAWWIHTSNHLKFLTTLSTSHLKCQPKSSTSRFPSPWTERETVSMETTSGSLSFFSPPRPSWGLCLVSISCRGNTESEGCVCVFMCVFKHSIESVFAVCARVCGGSACVY